MMPGRKFVDREEEIKALEEIHRREGFRFVVVVGRRRIGKSRLLTEFARGKKHLRVQFEKRPARYNLAKLNREIGKHKGIPTPNFSSFSDAFTFLRREDGLLIILDEFSYLIKYSDALAEFQTVVDEVLKDTNIMLVVLGSSFTVMKRGLLEYSAPLYGRTDLLMHLKPLKFRHLSEWFEGAKPEEVAMIYGAAGGVPRYLELFEGKNARKEIERNFFNPNSFLFREGRGLLEEEFDEPETYFAILEAISLGKRKVVEIANHAYIEAKNTAKYLKILRDLRLIRRIHPAGKRTGRGLYEFSDLYFAFWFRFVAPYFEDIEAGFDNEALFNFRENFNVHMGFVMERIAEESIPHLIGFTPIRIGRYWFRDVEIDLVVEGKDTVAFFEVKWKDIREKDCRRILRKLEEKASIYPAQDKERVYGIFAKGAECGYKDIQIFTLQDAHSL